MHTRKSVLSFLLALPALTLLGLAMPVVIGVPMWRDEEATWAFSSLGYRDLVTATGHVDRVFLPYYSLVHSLRLVGFDTWAIRLVSVAAAIGTVITVQLVARRLWSATAGFITSLALVMNPMFVSTATSMRPYAISTFCSALATYLVVCRPSWMSQRTLWWSYLATILLGVQLHLFTATLAVPHLLWLWQRVRHRVLPVAVAWTIALGATAPLAYLSSRQTGQVGWISAPTWSYTAQQTALATGSVPGTLGVLTTGIVVASALLGIYRSLQRRRFDPAWLIAVLLWLWPVVSLTIVSLLASPVSLSRYFMSTAVGAALLIGYGASTVRGWLWHVRPGGLSNRQLITAVAACTATCLLPALVIARPAPTSLEGHPEIDRQLARAVHSGDLLVIQQGMAETGYAYGIARALGDTAFQHDAERALVPGQPGMWVREVTSTDGTHVSSRATSPRRHRDVWFARLYEYRRLEEIGLRGCREVGHLKARQTTVVHAVCP